MIGQNFIDIDYDLVRDAIFRYENQIGCYVKYKENSTYEILSFNGS